MTYTIPFTANVTGTGKTLDAILAGALTQIQTLTLRPVRVTRVHARPFLVAVDETVEIIWEADVEFEAMDPS